MNSVNRIILCLIKENLYYHAISQLQLLLFKGKFRKKKVLLVKAQKMGVIFDIWFNSEVGRE